MGIYGIIPARMSSSRFPGKPLHPICGRPMLEHCYERAKKFERWSDLCVATCDEEIAEFAEGKGYKCVMTGDHHVRALDRVAEAATSLFDEASEEQVVVCVQADEPQVSPVEIDAVVAPLEDDAAVHCTVLTLPIVEESQFNNPDIVKLVHDRAGDVLYTSRSPIPHAAEFTPELGALRVGGLFGFRWKMLQWFASEPESRLEQLEACDSNRICDNGFRQRVSPVPYRPYYSVDRMEDVALVEAAMPADPLWNTY